MKNLIGMLIATTLLSTPAFAGGAPDFGTPDPESQAMLGKSDFNPVPEACEFRVVNGEQFCLSDGDFVRLTDGEPDTADFYETELDQDITENFAIPYHVEGKRRFSGSDEFCTAVLDMVASGTEFQGASCVVN